MKRHANDPRNFWLSEISILYTHAWIEERSGCYVLRFRGPDGPEEAAGKTPERAFQAADERMLTMRRNRFPEWMPDWQRLLIDPPEWVGRGRPAAVLVREADPEDA